MKEQISQMLVSCYQLLLWLYPRRFREEFGEEMTAVFQQTLVTAPNNWHILAAGLRELRDWPINCWRAYWHEYQRSLAVPYTEPISWRSTITAVRQLNHKKAARCLVAWLLLGLSALALISCSTLLTALENAPQTREMALADLDGDGDLDAFLANGRKYESEPNSVLFNDGDGRFSNSGQRLSNDNTFSVTLADLDNDGDTDALVGNVGAIGELFRNNGSGQFLSDGDLIPSRLFPRNSHIGLAELDGDDYIDTIMVSCCMPLNLEPGQISRTHSPTNHPPHNLMYVNVNGRYFSGTDQQFNSGGAEAIALGDLDSDGDVDAFIAATAMTHPASGETLIIDASGQVWFNQGGVQGGELGTFVDSGQLVGHQHSSAVALGDVDADGDLDVYIGYEAADELWLNDGNGFFTSSGQMIGENITLYAQLSDLDGDGDLDLFTANGLHGRFWFNDGAGNFSKGDQSIRFGAYHAVALGDVDGDGDIDLVAGHIDNVRVWFNEGRGKFR